MVERISSEPALQKKKPILQLRPKKHCESFGNFGVRIEEVEIDGIIKDTVRDLEQQLEYYDKSKALLDKLKES